MDRSHVCVKNPTSTIGYLPPNKSKNLLLRTQANDVFQAIRQAGLDPSSFELVEQDSLITPNLLVPAVVHKPTGYYCRFDGDANHLYDVRWSPAAQSMVGNLNVSKWDNNQIVIVRSWLVYLKREIEVPDFWASLAQETQLIEAASSSETGNTLFTSDEQVYISNQLREIENFLLTSHNLNKEQAEFVRNRLNYLEAASKRIGRVDWVNALVGVVFSVLVSAAFAPDEARNLLHFVTNALGQLLKSFPALP